MPSHLLGSKALLCSTGWPKLHILLSQPPKFWDHMPDCVGHFIYLLLFIEADFHVAQAGLGLPMYLRVAFNLQSSYPRLLRAGMTGVCPHT